MKITAKNKILIAAVVVFLVITAGEIICDAIWGDGDGVIMKFNIHKIIFSIQLIILYFLFLKFINKAYTVFFKNKISGNKVLQQAGKIFFILIILTFCFLVLEITSRYFFPAEGTFDHLYPVENARKPFPYVMFKGVANTPTGFGNEVYNKHGYRGNYPKMPKGSNEFRIIVLGGSAVWEGEPSIPVLLEEEFHANNYPNVFVYNFGVVSSVSSMELICILAEIANLSPDLIIMYNGANDMTLPFKYDPRPGYPFNFLVYENNPFLMRNYPALSLFAYKSNLVRLLCRKYFMEKFSRINELKKNIEYGSDKWKNEISDIYLSNLQKAATLCHAYHCEFYTFFQPMVWFKKNVSKEELEFLSEHKNDMSHHLILKNLILKKISSGENGSAGFYFKDISDVYDSDSSYIFRDDVHTFQAAKPRVAKKIFDEIISRVIIRK